MLVEELMIAANEAVAELLAGRDREAVYRVHEQPDPQSVELLLAKLADLEVPTPPAPDNLRPADAAKLAAKVSTTVMRYVEQTGRGREAYPPLVLRALKQARYDPRNPGIGPRQPRVLPLHLADPPLSRSPLPPGPPARARRARRGAPGRPLRGRRVDVVRERDAAQAEYRADELCLAWLLERGSSRTAGRRVRGRDRRRDRLGHLRALLTTSSRATCRRGAFSGDFSS